MGEEKPKSEDADENDRDGEPGAIEKPVQGSAVGCDHAFDEIAGPFFHSRAFVSGFAFAQNPCAHQRR